MSAELQTALTLTLIMDGGKQYFVLDISSQVQGLLVQWPSTPNDTMQSIVLALHWLLRLSHTDNKTLSYVSASNTITTFRVSESEMVSHELFYGFGYGQGVRRDSLTGQGWTTLLTYRAASPWQWKKSRKDFPTNLGELSWGNDLRRRRTWKYKLPKHNIKKKKEVKKLLVTEKLQLVGK